MTAIIRIYREKRRWVRAWDRVEQACDTLVMDTLLVGLMGLLLYVAGSLALS